MVSPGTLRVLAELRESDRDVIEPTVGKTGTISYPFLDRHLDDRDVDPDAVLESMTDRGVLRSSFEYKVYICPDCAAEGMQYSSGCPDCGSVYATREPMVVHSACDGVLEPDALEGDADADADADADVTCPTCDERVTEDDLERRQRYECRDCNSLFDDPTHRLWCRDCGEVHPPAETREEPLYRYFLTDTGDQWIESQLEARRSLAAAFDDRRYETTVDTIVAGDGGGGGGSDETGIPVHVHAEDTLLEDRIVAAVHESPTDDDVERLSAAARAVGARPVVLVTDGTVDERIADRLDAEGVTILTADEDGLTREYEIRDRPREPDSLLDRFVSVLESSASRS